MFSSITPPLCVPNLRVLGRTYAPSNQSPLPLFWAASGVELNYTGSELWVEWETDFTKNEPWILVELNGCPILRMPLPKGRSCYCLFRGLTPGVPRRVRIFKETQPVTDDPYHLLQLVGLGIVEGQCVPLPNPHYRLEFVGDSITSGEGAVGSIQETDWSSAFLSPYHTYARMTADALEAEFRLISQSGWGVLASWENDPHCAMPPIYEKVCGSLTDSRSLALGAGAAQDFFSWQPDAVIVHLGTNDDFALKNPPRIDPNSGESYALRDPHQITAEAIRFLTLLRRCNPNAQLVWCYGMMGQDLRETLEQAVDRYILQSHDSRAHFLLLPDLTPEGLGALEHPGEKSHQAAAQLLTKFLENLL